MVAPAGIGDFAYFYKSYAIIVPNIRPFDSSKGIA